MCKRMFPSLYKSHEAPECFTWICLNKILYFGISTFSICWVMQSAYLRVFEYLKNKWYSGQTRRDEFCSLLTMEKYPRKDPYSRSEKTFCPYCETKPVPERRKGPPVEERDDLRCLLLSRLRWTDMIPRQRPRKAHLSAKFTVLPEYWNSSNKSLRRIVYLPRTVPFFEVLVIKCFVHNRNQKMVFNIFNLFNPREFPQERIEERPQTDSLQNFRGQLIVAVDASHHLKNFVAHSLQLVMRQREVQSPIGVRAISVMVNICRFEVSWQIEELLSCWSDVQLV